MTNRDSVRFEAELDQLKAKMVDAIAINGEEWFFGIDDFCLAAVASDNELLAGLARFAKIGMAEVVKSYTPIEDDEE